MSFWADSLQCSDPSFYTGHTDDLESSIGQLGVGGDRRHTRSRRPLELVFFESFAMRDVALAAERRIKGWSRAKNAALIERNGKRHRVLARSGSARASTGSARAESARPGRGRA